ncbi:MAG: hypothetical protein AB9869_07270 [Verrucomicrobiia bacterium]
MAGRAQVSSVEAVGEFRSRLIVYISKVRSALEEASDEIRQTRTWLENVQRPHWEWELRRRTRDLEEKEQVLFSAKLSRILTQSAAQVLAVERAKRAVHDAEEKRLLINKWIREFENRAEPLGKQVEQMLTFVSTDLGKAAVHLGNLMTALEAYAAVASDAGAVVATGSATLAPPARDSSTSSPDGTVTEEAPA